MFCYKDRSLGCRSVYGNQFSKYSKLKKERYPDKVFGIYIQDLFNSYLDFRKIKKKDCEIKTFSIPSNEKLCENLDFEPDIVELDTRDKIMSMIEIGLKGLY